MRSFCFFPVFSLQLKLCLSFKNNLKPVLPWHSFFFKLQAFNSQTTAKSWHPIHPLQRIGGQQLPFQFLSLNSMWEQSNVPQLGEELSSFGLFHDSVRVCTQNGHRERQNSITDHKINPFQSCDKHMNNNCYFIILKALSNIFLVSSSQLISSSGNRRKGES